MKSNNLFLISLSITAYSAAPAMNKIKKKAKPADSLALSSRTGLISRRREAARPGIFPQ